MRTITRSAAIALTALVFTGCGAPTNASRDTGRSPDAPSGPPNILWIIAEPETPALGELAAEGARFTQAFAVTPDGVAGRSAILTGMYPAAIGIHRSGVTAVPPPHVRSVAETLRAAGYFTTFASHNRETAALGDAFRPPSRDDAPPGAERVPLARISHSSRRSGMRRRVWGSGRPDRTPAVVWTRATTCAWHRIGRVGTPHPTDPCPLRS